MRSSIQRHFHSFSRLGVVLLAVTLVGLSPWMQSASGAPEPSLIPTRWELDFEPGPLRIAMVEVERQVEGPNGSVAVVRQPEAFMYFTYTVMNNTGEDRMFAPSFELAMGDGDLLKSGQNVPASVTRELLQRLNNPFLLDQIGIIGTLEQGEENAREGLVIWPAGQSDMKADEAIIFASGLSGEFKRVTRPDTGEEVTLRKVMMLRHHTPGDRLGQGDRPFNRVQQRWILR
ncbi:MAG: hypothetical protein ACF8GE_01215 [Phycisphaerales bacterium JB043]